MGRREPEREAGGPRTSGGAPLGISSLILPQTSCLGSSRRSMYVTGLPPPCPHLREKTSETVSPGHTGEQNAFLSKLLYMLPRGEVAQGCVGTDLWASAW